MSTAVRSLALAIFIASLAPSTAAAASSAAPAGDGPDATAARGCILPRGGRGLGPTYVRSLRVSGTSCRIGVRVVKAYYRCRIENGGRRGRCRSRVLGFRCNERRGASIPTQFDARAICEKGRARVDHRYTQFT